jgi:hypothetical protein
MSSRILIPSLLALALLLGACGTEHSSLTSERARQLVENVEVADAVPEISVESAESLYGEDATAVCGPLEDDRVNIVTWGRIPLRGMPEEKTEDLIDYDRVVVQTYCPDVEPELDDLLRELHYGE